MTSLWTDLDRTFSELDRLMRVRPPTPRGPRHAPARPTLRATRGEQGWSLEVDLPGVSAEQVRIEVEDGALLLEAAREPQVPEGARVLRKERAAWSLQERIDLPPEVDVDAITARLRDGRLRIQLPTRAPVRRSVAVETD